MRRLLISASVALACALAATPASAEFGFKAVDLRATDADGSLSLQAGSHPFALSTTLDVNTLLAPGGEAPEGEFRDLDVALPAGLVGTPTPGERCSGEDFLDIDLQRSLPACPDSSAVGVGALKVGYGQFGYLDVPVYNLVPPPGVAAKLGFVALNVPVTIEAKLREEPPYNIVSRATNIAQAISFYGAELTLWGVPADPVHDPLRGSCLKTFDPTPGVFVSEGNCSAGIAEKPFLTLPRACRGPMATEFWARAWNTGAEDTATALTPSTHDCAKLGFSPGIEAQPSTDHAESPSGLEVTLDAESPGLMDPDGTADSDIEKTVVTFPEGVTINPSQAEGLATCSEADLARERSFSEPGEGCPQASKVGTVEIQNPLLEGKVLEGSVFVATPYENLAEDALIAIYVVVKSRELGVLVKQPGKVTPDPLTGQLVSTFEDMPQFPLGQVRLRLREGGRSPLVTPPACGTYTTKAEFTPYANPASPYTTTSTFEITRGVNGGPCPPGGAAPFEPGFTAGALNNAAATHSPFYMRLTRRDGDQDLTRFDAVLPKGVVAKLAGTTQCPQASIEAAKTRDGKDELASPSCPPSSYIGRAVGGAGVGSQLTYVNGSVYLAGSYGGAPLSVVAIVPAVAGPFDVGTVVVQQALRIDPKSAEVKVDGGSSDPLPHILAGIPLRVRDIRVYVDKPNFALNPTSCDPSDAIASLWGGGIDPFSIADNSPVTRNARFQAAGCASLGFKPKLNLNLKGGMRRGDFPALSTILTPRPGDANLEDLVLRLPRSAFLEQGHFRTICTRVQFAAGPGNGAQCPAGSIYGKVRVWTPILDAPAEGSLYLRSSSHDLPDIVLALQGPPSAPAKVEVTARVDSQKGGIRVSVQDVPDLPVTKALVTTQGGQKGLIVNSRNLCAKPSRASVEANGQNGKRARLKPLVKATGCKKKRAQKHRQGSRGKRAKR